ncbi:unnamed protein product, partial [Pocillopora meandrina]
GGFLCLVDLLTPRPTNESGVGADSATGGYGDKYGKASNTNEREFNKKLSAAKSVVERAFGACKGRWRLLLKKVEQQTRTLSKTVLAACVLHNICGDNGDLYDCSDSDSDDSDSDNDYEGPLREGGAEVRETLKNFVWDNF